MSDISVYDINAWMHSLIKSVKPEIVNRYDLWVLRHKIGGAKQVFVNNVQWSDHIHYTHIFDLNNLNNKGAFFF
jgi:hypothetical protein